MNEYPLLRLPRQLVAAADFSYARAVAHRNAAAPTEQCPRYLEAPTPIVFPEEAEVPETQVHFELRILLYQLLRDHLGWEATIGSDQFVYCGRAVLARSAWH